jgi:hypothetical protein
VIDGAGEKAAGPAGGIEQDFAGMRVYAVGHESGDSARRVVFAGIAGRLQVIQELLVELAEVPALVKAVRILERPCDALWLLCVTPRSRRAP